MKPSFVIQKTNVDGYVFEALIVDCDRNILNTFTPRELTLKELISVDQDFLDDWENRTISDLASDLYAFVDNSGEQLFVLSKNRNERKDIEAALEWWIKEEYGE